MPRISERLQVALVALAGLAVAAFWAYLLTTTPKPEPFTSPTESVVSATSQKRVTIAGDGFTAPTPAGGNGQSGYPSLLGSRYGWQVTTFTNEGMGYVTG